MKIFKLLAISLVILIAAIGIASSADISEFHAPDGFDDGIGESMDKDDFSIKIEDYDKEFDYDNFFKSSHFVNITVKGKIAEYTDDFHEEVGVKEIVKFGKSNYVVTCKYKANDTSKIADCTKYIKEFNKKNDLEPVAIKDISDF